MRYRYHGVLGFISLLLSLTVSAGAQEAPRSAIRLETPSFVFARYATVSAASLYAARGFGPAGAFVGIVQNPRTEYRELIVGGFTQVNWGRQSAIVALGYADATESEYLQTYLSPSLVAGNLSLSGTIEWYEPLEAPGVRQLDVNPLALFLRVHQRFAVGGIYTQGMAEGDALRHRAGPAVEVYAPWGSFRIEVLRRFADDKTEVRTVALAAF